MPTRQEFIEAEVRTLNEQLYNSYKHITELTDKITKLEKTVADQQDVIDGLAAG